MNFCFLNTLKGSGGLELQTILRAVDAIKFGHHSLVIVSSKTPSENFAQKHNLPIATINTCFHHFNINLARKLAHIFSKNNIDVCVVPKSNLLFSGILAKKLSRKKVAIVFYQQMQSGIPKKDPYHNFIYKNLDGAIVLTERMKKMLIATTILPAERIFVVPYGVDRKKFDSISKEKRELRAEYGLPLDKYLVGCIGRIEHRKGQLVLIDSLLKANLSDFALVLVGKIDEEAYFEKIKKKVATNGLLDSFIYKEFTNDIPQIIKSLDVFVLPSNSETFGLVLIEAMASAIPIIATNSGGVPEIITDGVDGLLFEPFDSEHLAQLLRRVYRDKELVYMMTQSAKEKIKIKFDYERNVNKFFEVCQLTFHRR
ncbi:MAG: glycosyltransferase family 4 protein [Candidatus Kapaibacteriales bacterium]